MTTKQSSPAGDFAPAMLQTPYHVLGECAHCGAFPEALWRDPDCKGFAFCRDCWLDMIRADANPDVWHPHVITPKGLAYLAGQLAVAGEGS